MKATLRRLSIPVMLVIVLCVLWPSAGSAQIPLPLPTGSPTPTKSPTPTPTKSPTPTPTKTSSPSPKPTSSSTKPKPDGSDEKSSAKKSRENEVDPAVAKGVRTWLGRKRTPARTTTRLLELLDKTQPGGREPSFAAKRAAFGQFPVVGYVWFQDDYGAPRYFPYYHPHEGTDLFARSGTPVIAVSDGTIARTATGGGGGNAVWLQSADGVRYYYGHMRSIAKGIKIGSEVRQGDLLGRVGATGASAKGTYPHVHFEINPGGRGTINPKPVLDAWLDAAEAAALGQLGVTRARNALARFGAARWDLLSDILSEPVGGPPPFWAFAFDGSGASIAFGDDVLRRALDDRVGLVSPHAGADGSVAASFLRPIDSLASLSHVE